MAYTKTIWKARQGVKLNKFTKSEETETSVVLTNTPDSITEPGTPFSVENMNHIEEGLVELDETKAPANADLTEETGEGTDTTTPAVASTTLATILQTIWGKIRQVVNVLTTKAPIASPTFTGTPKMPNKTSLPVYDGTLIATEAQFFGGDILRPRNHLPAGDYTSVDFWIKLPIGIYWNDNYFQINGKNYWGTVIVFSMNESNEPWNKTIFFIEHIAQTVFLSSVTQTDPAVRWKIIGAVDYSTEEQDTGIKWIDGRPVFSRVLTLTRALMQAGASYTFGTMPDIGVVDYTAPFYLVPGGGAEGSTGRIMALVTGEIIFTCLVTTTNSDDETFYLPIRYVKN